MTLDEAIRFAEDIASRDGPAKAKHVLLAKWLKELSFLRFWRDHAYDVLKNDLEWSFPLEFEGEYINSCPTCFNSAEDGHEPDCALGVLLVGGSDDEQESSS